MKSSLKTLAASLSRALPKTHFFDMLLARAAFLSRLGRLPKARGGTFPDFLFQMKLNRTLEEPLRRQVSDKEHVKSFISDKLGDAFNVPTLAILRSEEEIDCYEFPNRCCIKPSHASGQVILRKNGEAIDRDRLKNWLLLNYYDKGRERNYKDLARKILVEPLIFDSVENEDLKFFCFNGRAKMIQIDHGRFSDHRRLYLTPDWQVLPFSILKPQLEWVPERPSNLDKLLNVAQTLARAFSFIRVDLYTDGETVYVGELTNMPEAGFTKFIPRSAEALATKLILN
ncbi:MAG: ATP-grasp fold amidoligase family protein [Pseudomonadota bacterium]